MGYRGKGYRRQTQKLGLNTTLPGEARTTRGTGVCERERKGIFRRGARKHGVGTWK